MGDDGDFIQARELEVQHTVKYETLAEDMTTAWAFVMAHIDKVGPEPSVTIRPCLVWKDQSVGGEGKYYTQFRCKISGRIDQM